MTSTFIAPVLGLALALGGAARAAGHEAETIPRPAVPANLEVGSEFRLFLKGHAIGTHNYICAPAATATGVDWLFIGPQATLFDEDSEQIVTHVFSRNPEKANAIQASWQHSRDTSAVWATRRDGSTDPQYVSPTAIEWLILDASGHQLGPTAGGKLARTAIIQRVHTAGGVKPPSSECTAATLNTRRFVPYEADYYFYR